MTLYNHKLVYRPLRGGVEIFNTRVNEVGTLGFIAQLPQGGSERWIVSCYHVLVGGPGQITVDGEEIFQPSDGDAVAAVDAARVDVNLDCAAAKILNGIAAIGEILGIGKIGDPTEPVVGMRLLKSGAVSGLTEGVVEAVAGDDVIIAVPASLDPNYIPSLPGDSGSLWLVRETLQPVALHVQEIVGSTRKCRGRRIISVLTALNLDIAKG